MLLLCPNAVVQSYNEVRVNKEQQKVSLCLLALNTRKARRWDALGFPQDRGRGFGDMRGIWKADLGILYAIKGISMKPVLQVGCILLDRRCFASKT